jgi:hypothetical protein
VCKLSFAFYGLLATPKKRKKRQKARFFGLFFAFLQKKRITQALRGRYPKEKRRR